MTWHQYEEELRDHSRYHERDEVVEYAELYLLSSNAMQ